MQVREVKSQHHRATGPDTVEAQTVLGVKTSKEHSGQTKVSSLGTKNKHSESKREEVLAKAGTEPLAAVCRAAYEPSLPEGHNTRLPACPMDFLPYQHQGME